MYRHLNYWNRKMRLTIVLYVIVILKGIHTKSIQNDTLDSRISTLEKLVDKLEARINKTGNSIDTIQGIDEHKKAVFYAQLTSSKNLNIFSTIQFDKVIINEGGHYNPTDGVFVAPVSGVYMFAWKTHTYNKYLFTELRVNGVVKGSFGGNAASSQHLAASMSLVCHTTCGYRPVMQ